MPKLILPGGSGFLGRTLTKFFAAKGWDVVILTRGSAKIEGARCVQWDGRTLGRWFTELEGADAVLNLAGRSVNCRYTIENRRQMMASRVESTRVLGQAIAICEHPPKVWLNSSTATIYKHTYNVPHGEDGEVGATPEAKDAYSIEVAKAWESAFEKGSTPSTRKLVLRAAMVMGNEPGGVYEVLRRLTRFGLGGHMGDGRQFISWIHAQDFCRAILWLIDNPRAEGVYNLSAPHPIPNAEMMRLLREKLAAPVGLPATRWMLEIGAFFLRTETELILKSRRVVPSRLLTHGFVFHYPTFALALDNLESIQRSAAEGRKKPKRLLPHVEDRDASRRNPVS